jgi:hypothetical protein
MCLALQEQLDAESVIGLLETLGKNPAQIVLTRKDPNWSEIWAELQVQMLISREDLSGLKAPLANVGAIEALQLIHAFESAPTRNLGPLKVKLQRYLTQNQLRGVLAQLGFSKNKITQLVGPHQVLWMELWAYLESAHSFGPANPTSLLHKVREAQVKTPGLSVMIAAIETYLNS